MANTMNSPTQASTSARSDRLDETVFTPPASVAVERERALDSGLFGIRNSGNQRGTMCAGNKCGDIKRQL